MKDQSDIENKRDDASTASNNAPKYPGMTYAEGVRDALDWVLGDYEGDLEL